MQAECVGEPGLGPVDLWLEWISNRKGGDILHGHDSKVCQRAICQLCRQQRRYQGRGTKRTVFPAR